MTATVTTRIKEQMLEEIDELSEQRKMDRATLLRNLIQEALEKEKQKHILELYKEGEVTLEKAAEMLGISIWEMIELLKEKDIHLHYTKEELQKDLEPVVK